MTEPIQRSIATDASSLANARALVAKRTSSVTPARLSALLVASAGGGLFLASVWATEPEPLPTRTQIAFGLCLVIAFSWSVFAAHGLLRRQRLLVHQRVVAASMGLVFSAVFTLLGLGVAIAENQGGRAIFVGITGFLFIAAAALLLWRARSAREELEVARASLMHR